MNSRAARSAGRMVNDAEMAAICANCYHAKAWHISANDRPLPCDYAADGRKCGCLAFVSEKPEDAIRRTSG